MRTSFIQYKWKTFTSLTALMALVFSSVALAGTINLDVGEKEELTHCGGTVSFSEKDGKYFLKFSDVVDCSNVKIDGDEHKLGGEDRARSGSFTLPKSLVRTGHNEVTVKLESNSGKTWDTINLHFDVAPARRAIRLGDEVKLLDCGGRMKITKSNVSEDPRDGEQLNVVLHDVQNCSNFSWDSVNGKSGKSYKLQGKPGRYNASYTLSWKYLTLGRNEALITLKSDDGEVMDRFTLRFEVVRR